MLQERIFFCRDVSATVRSYCVSIRRQLPQRSGRMDALMFNSSLRHYRGVLDEKEEDHMREIWIEQLALKLLISREIFKVMSKDLPKLSRAKSRLWVRKGICGRKA